jgi:hypothetical protein
MANISSPKLTYSDTTPQKTVITDLISIIDPSDTPLIEALGGLDGAASKFRFTEGDSTVVKWLEDTLTPLTGVLANSATIASTDTTMTVGDANMVQEGHILLIDAEQVWVSGKASAVITVTRNYGGTQASHDSIAAFTIIGMARLEGDDSDDLGYTDVSVNSNYTQIYHKEIQVSGSQQKIAQYGIDDEFNYQAAKAVPELMRLIERQLYYGVRSAGSSTSARSMGGLSTFITDNKVSGATLSQAAFEDAVEAAFNDGGPGPWLAPVNSTNYQKIKNFYDSSNYLRVDVGQTEVGMEITAIKTPFGRVNLLLDRWALSGTIPIVDVNRAGLLTYRPFTQEELAKTGDSKKGEVIGEFTLCVKDDKAHALLTSVS